MEDPTVHSARCSWHWVDSHEQYWRILPLRNLESMDLTSDPSQWLIGKKSTCKARDLQESWVPSLGGEDPLEEEMASHSSILTWRILWIEEPGGLYIVHGSQSRTWLGNWAHTGMTSGSSVQFSCSAVSDSLRPHKSQHTRSPCPSPTPEFTQTHVLQVGDANQPSHPRLSPFPPAPNHSQYQSFFQWVNSSHEVAKVLEFQF